MKNLYIVLDYNVSFISLKYNIKGSTDNIKDIMIIYTIFYHCNASLFIKRFSQFKHLKFPQFRFLSTFCILCKYAINMLPR